MDQNIIVLIIVFAALFYALYKVSRSFLAKNDKGCGDSCSCGSRPDLKTHK